MRGDIKRTATRRTPAPQGRTRTRTRTPRGRNSYIADANGDQPITRLDRLIALPDAELLDCCLSAIDACRRSRWETDWFTYRDECHEACVRSGRETIWQRAVAKAKPAKVIEGRPVDEATGEAADEKE